MSSLENATPHHRLSATGRAGGLTLSFRATFSAPWTVLFGPSGCGKSTVLRAVCGLASTSLAVELDRAAPDGWQPLQNAQQATPPERRQLAYAPQQAVLFPHLSVRKNILFAQAVRGRSSDRADLLDALLDLFDLRALAERLPHQLSGGERQRVSLARALAVPDARLMLLDEPFAGVDRPLRDELLPRLRAWIASRGIPAISVTHDVDEALLLQAEVIRLEDGRNAAQGPAREVLHADIARLRRALDAYDGSERER